MSKQQPKSFIDDIKYKNLTVFWFSFKQLMYSRLNIGVIILILIPLLASGMYASGAFKDLDESDEEQKFYAKDDPFYFHEQSDIASVDITEEQFSINEHENYFKLDITGTTTGPIEIMDVSIIFYYEHDWVQYLSKIQDMSDDFGPPPIPPDGYDFLADSYSNNGFTSGNDSDEKDIYNSWHYSEDDSQNWTSCRLKFYSIYDDSESTFSPADLAIRIDAENTLPLFVERDFIIQLGLINFSASNTSTSEGWNWSQWDLSLEFGKMDLIFGGGFDDIYGDLMTPDIFSELDRERNLWPYKIFVYINGHGNTPDGYVQLAQATHSQFVKDPPEPPDPPGHEVFIHAAGVLYFMFIIPIIILLYISAAISDDSENRTITYLTSRPISKTNLIMSKYFSAYFAAFFMIIPSIILSYFVMVGYKDGMEFAIDNIGILGTYCGLVVLGLFIYSAVFTLFTSISRHPLIFGLIYIFFLDQLISRLPFSINKAGINYYISSIAHHKLSGYTELYVFQPMDSFDAGLILVIATCTLLVFACLFYNDKDFH